MVSESIPSHPTTAPPSPQSGLSHDLLITGSESCDITPTSSKPLLPSSQECLTPQEGFNSIAHTAEEILNAVKWSGMLKPEHSLTTLKPSPSPKDFREADHSPTIQKTTIQKDSTARTDHDLPSQRSDLPPLAVLALTALDVTV